MTDYISCPQPSLDTSSSTAVQQATVSVLAGNLLFAALLLAVGFVAYKLFGLLGAHCCNLFYGLTTSCDIGVKNDMDANTATMAH